MQKMIKKGFHATSKIYITQFKRWGTEFNKNKNADGTRPVSNTSAPRTRPRGCIVQIPQSAHVPYLQPHPSMAVKLSDGYEIQKNILNSAEVYIYGLFNNFNLSADMFSIMVPMSRTDNSLAWQQHGELITSLERGWKTWLVPRRTMG
ncbi:hypothetical protein EDB82DRAFT_355332 [Fusarium venenatum]|uniref:uncharacterized protein n=1 Tax=Fusarium venenatum TaxID=56646 RepID=UPI001E188F9B|nr:hypothetical protein EDB82DRAFT_355332 [Fusarium venenatum]